MAPILRSSRAKNCVINSSNDGSRCVGNRSINNVKTNDIFEGQKQGKKVTTSNLTTSVPKNTTSDIFTSARRYPLRDRKTVNIKGIVPPHKISKKGMGAVESKMFVLVDNSPAISDIDKSYSGTPPPPPLFLYCYPPLPGRSYILPPH